MGPHLTCGSGPRTQTHRHRHGVSVLLPAWSTPLPRPALPRPVTAPCFFTAVVATAVPIAVTGTGAPWHPPRGDRAGGHSHLLSQRSTRNGARSGRDRDDCPAFQKHCSHQPFTGKSEEAPGQLWSRSYSGQSCTPSVATNGTIHFITETCKVLPRPPLGRVCDATSGLGSVRGFPSILPPR